ncbi:MAG TPA: response regulator [Candidatus Deferrimicrobium sp.]|nr:response regulator [Candidatus Deferrimicrobium sp.]
MQNADKKSVLVVDDEEIIRSFLADVLGGTFDVTLVADGDEAIDQLNRRRFDLIITDLKMQRVQGEEVVKFARQQDPDARVIVISGFSSLYTVARSINHGACAFLSKPFSIKELMRVVDEAVYKEVRS